jgi:hypothetical protein
MKFLITMTVPTKNQMSHQIVAEHESQSIEEFLWVLQNQDFILVEEWQPQGDGHMENKGKLIINQHNVAKVRVLGNR